MSVSSLVRKASTRLAVASVLTTGALGLCASSALATETVTPALTVTPNYASGTTVSAGANPTNVVADATFTYGDTTDSVTSLTATLPKGFWASLAAAPSGTVIGSSVINPSSLNIPLTVTSAGPPATQPTGIPSGDVALLNVTLTNTTYGLSISGYVAIDPTGPNLLLVVPSIPNLHAILGAQLTELTLTISGQVTPAGSTTAVPFLRLPSYSTAAVTGVTVGTAESATGTANASTNPLSGTPAFTPSIASVKATVLDQTSKNATVNVDIQQPLGQAGVAGNAITLPSSALAFNANAVNDIASKSQVGTASLTTPLLSSAVPGTVTVGGTTSAPTMTVTFNLAGAMISFTGTVTNLFSNPTVTFTGVPDVPFTDLAISLTGGSTGLFNATCATGTSNASGSFTSQWNSSLTATSAAVPVQVSGCPAPATTTTPTQTTTTPTQTTTTQTKKPSVTPKLSSASVGGLAKGTPKFVFSAAQVHGGQKIESITIALPKGLSFVKKGLKKGVALSSAKLKSEVISHGKLVITLKTATSKVKVTISSKALSESSSLKTQIKKHKVKSLSFAIYAKTKNSNVKQTVKLTKLS